MPTTLVGCYALVRFWALCGVHRYIVRIERHSGKRNSEGGVGCYCKAYSIASERPRSLCCRHTPRIANIQFRHKWNAPIYTLYGRQMCSAASERFAIQIVNRLLGQPTHIRNSLCPPETRARTINTRASPKPPIKTRSAVVPCTISMLREHTRTEIYHTYKIPAA